MNTVACRKSACLLMLSIIALSVSSLLHAAMPDYPPVLQRQAAAVAIAKSQRTLNLCWVKAEGAQLDPNKPLDSKCAALLKPVIMSLYPPAPVAGEEVKISGTNLKRANITVAGARVIPIFRSDNELRFVAPEHAMGDYELKLESPVGSTSARIVYAQEVLANPDAGQSSFATDGEVSCVVTPDGFVKCWGDNRYGQLGNGKFVNSSTPVTVTGISNAIAIAVANGRNCALLATGPVYCWGFGFFGVTSAVPVPVAGITNAIALSMSDRHACVIVATGQVQCWGSNSDGQLGDGTFNHSATPVTAIGFSNAASLFTSGANSCAVTVTHRVWCWGDNGAGQLRGDNIDKPKPVLINEALNVRSVIEVRQMYYQNNGTYGTVCALLTSGTVRCWYPERGTVYDRGISDATYVLLGRSCEIVTDGRVRCGGTARVGVGEDGYVVGIDDAKAIFAVDKRTCAVLGSGHLQCWDEPDSVAWNSPAPVHVGIGPTTSVDVGIDTGCAVLAAGAIRCWGENYEGGLGNGTVTRSLLPVSVRAISDGVTVGVGNGHACALLNSGNIKCWGSGGFGQLGNSSYSNSLVPVPVTGISNAVALDIRGEQSAALLADGTPMHWGYTASWSVEEWPDENGEFPNGGTLTQSFHDSRPVAIPYGGVQAMHDQCMLRSPGDVVCWSTITVSYGVHEPPEWWPTGEEPVPVLDHPVLSYSSLQLNDIVGMSYRCFIVIGGSVQCRERNSDRFAVVPGISNAVAIENRGAHACVLLATGAVQCWGSNRYGQLGDGTFANSMTPVNVAGLDGTGIKAVALSAGAGNTCAILETGALYCWGYSGLLAQAPRPFMVRETLDVDLDGVEDSSDNCPFAWNPDQRDSDQNGKGDVCEDIVF